MAGTLEEVIGVVQIGLVKVIDCADERGETGDNLQSQISASHICSDR